MQRHAKTEPDAATDKARVLIARGRRDARAAGGWIRDNDLAPDLIVASPAARAYATALLVSAELRDPPEVRIVDDLYGADVDDVIEIVNGLDADIRRAMVVGHNPTMAQLAYDLQATPQAPWAGQLPTSGIAVVQMAGGWPDVRPKVADLVQWYVPRAD